MARCERGAILHNKFRTNCKKGKTMKKVSTLLFLLALAVGANARVRPNAHPGPSARSASIKRSVKVVPPASRTPNAVNHAKKK